MHTNLRACDHQIYENQKMIEELEKEKHAFCVVMDAKDQEVLKQKSEQDSLRNDLSIGECYLKEKDSDLNASNKDYERLRKLKENGDEKIICLTQDQNCYKKQLDDLDASLANLKHENENLNKKNLFSKALCLFLAE